MLTYILRRLLLTVPVMLFVMIFVFGILQFAPGDPAAILAGDTASAAEIASVRDALGLDGSVTKRFVIWIGNVAQGDLGKSLYTRQDVSTIIFQRLAPTYTLMLMTLAISVGLAIPLGVLAGWKLGRWQDGAVMIGAVLVFSIPSFAVGYFLAWLLGLKLGWFPVQGYAPMSGGVFQSVRSLVLPSLALSSIYIALIARMTRATMAETLSQDYIRTARAKGLGTFQVLFGHALRNAAVPIVTVVASGVALLISGTVVIETVFAIPGLGRLTTDSILRRDYPVIQAVTLLFSITYVLVNLIADLLYRFFDPRVKL